jgi:hypothetical protein
LGFVYLKFLEKAWPWRASWALGRVYYENSRTLQPLLGIIVSARLLLFCRRETTFYNKAAMNKTKRRLNCSFGVLSPNTLCVA